MKETPDDSGPLTETKLATRIQRLVLARFQQLLRTFTVGAIFALESELKSGVHKSAWTARRSGSAR
jgi:hypothetical protein